MLGRVTGPRMARIPTRQMNVLILTVAVLSGPHAPEPTRTAWLIVEPAQAESAAVISEWDRQSWPLAHLRNQCDSLFRWRSTDPSRCTGITTVPCIVLGQRAYPIRAHYSGQAIREIHRLATEYVREADFETAMW